MFYLLLLAPFILGAVGFSLLSGLYVFWVVRKRPQRMPTLAIGFALLGICGLAWWVKAGRLDPVTPITFLSLFAAVDAGRRGWRTVPLPWALAASCVLGTTVLVLGAVRIADISGSFERDQGERALDAAVRDGERAMIELAEEPCAQLQRELEVPSSAAERITLLVECSNPVTYGFSYEHKGIHPDSPLQGYRLAAATLEEVNGAHPSPRMQALVGSLGEAIAARGEELQWGENVSTDNQTSIQVELLGADTPTPVLRISVVGVL